MKGKMRGMIWMKKKNLMKSEFFLKLCNFFNGAFKGGITSSFSSLVYFLDLTPKP